MTKVFVRSEATRARISAGKLGRERPTDGEIWAYYTGVQSVQKTAAWCGLCVERVHQILELSGRERCRGDHGNGSCPPWEQAKIDKLLSLDALGLSRAQIGRLMGMTKNKVHGKLTRLAAAAAKADAAEKAASQQADKAA